MFDALLLREKWNVWIFRLWFELKLKVYLCKSWINVLESFVVHLLDSKVLWKARKAWEIEDCNGNMWNLRAENIWNSLFLYLGTVKKFWNARNRGEPFCYRKLNLWRIFRNWWMISSFKSKNDIKRELELALRKLSLVSREN